MKCNQQHCYTTLQIHSVSNRWFDFVNACVSEWKPETVVENSSEITSYFTSFAAARPKQGSGPDQSQKTSLFSLAVIWEHISCLLKCFLWLEWRKTKHKSTRKYQIYKKIIHSLAIQRFHWEKSDFFSITELL